MVYKTAALIRILIWQIILNRLIKYKMTTDNKDNRLSIENSDYAEILRHAVAVIEHARTEIARHVNGYVSTAYGRLVKYFMSARLKAGMVTAL